MRLTKSVRISEVIRRRFFSKLLDPEQNAAFIDHYLEIPIDLSRVMFLTTANEPERLPQPLLDRMEIVEFSGYTVNEKKIIAANHLIPDQLNENGLLECKPEFTDKALEKIITDYTQEAGIRGLNREIGNICRKVARLTLQQKGENEVLPLLLDEEQIVNFLGPSRFHREAAEGSNTVGVVTALVWTRYGGEIMFIEARMMPGSSQLTLTGSMGEILRESAQTALSYIRSNTKNLGIEPDFFRKAGPAYPSACRGNIQGRTIGWVSHLPGSYFTSYRPAGTKNGGHHRRAFPDRPDFAGGRHQRKIARRSQGRRH